MPGEIFPDGQAQGTQQRSEVRQDEAGILEDDEQRQVEPQTGDQQGLSFSRANRFSRSPGRKGG